MSGGLGFPFLIADRGSVRPAGATAERARAQLRQLLFTAPGERVDRPAFGCGLHLLVFSAPSAEQAALTEYVVGTAIRRYLDRLVRLDAVRVTLDDATLVIDVLYSLREDGQELAATFTSPLRTPTREPAP